MSLEEIVKFTPEEVERLFNNPHARERTNFVALAEKRIPLIAQIYGVSSEEVKKVISKWPQFADYDHKRVVREAVEVYGIENESKVKKSTLSFPPFAGLDHERVIREAVEVYGIENESKVKKSTLSFPQFADYDHKRVVREAVEVYGIENESKVKKSTLSFPPFAGLDHERVVREAVEVYGIENESKVKKASLSFPQFAGYDHERVVRQMSRLGKIVGLEMEKVIEKILKTPALAGYSVKRYLAGLGVCRKLQNEGFENNDYMLRAYFNNLGKSPYVPNSDRKRISQVENGEEPPLLTAMRKSLKYKLNQ